jgi:DNA-binding transcriptional LysR family regulator
MSTSSSSSLTITQLQCFVAVVDTGSFAEAGRRLGLTTSGVSKTLTRFEAAKGVQLLNRSTHAISLTQEGERLIDLARDALHSIEQVDLAMSSASGTGTDGRVRLSVPTAFLSACLTPLLPQFRVAHPNILLDLRGSDVMIDLADEAVDLALRTGPIYGIPGHLQQVLFRFPWVTCASPHYLARRGTPLQPADLIEHDLIGFRNQRTGTVDPWRYRHGAGAQSDAARWVPSPRVIVDDANAVHAAGIAGAGVLWAPRWLVRDSLQTQRLMPVLSDWSADEMEMSIIRRDQAYTPERVGQVITFLKESRSSFL